MIDQELLEKYPTKLVGRLPCWTVDVAATIMGCHHNTIINHVERARRGSYSFPYIQSVRRSKIWIPAEPFIAWMDSHVNI